MVNIIPVAAFLTWKNEREEETGKHASPHILPVLFGYLQ
jgi:hypothetical protein